MQIIRWVSLLAALVGLSWLTAFYAPVKADALSTYFSNLASPYTARCCDVADCHVAESDYREDAEGAWFWWAKSNQTGEWVQIPPEKITTDDSVFPQAILCEAPPRLSNWTAIVFCFARPPSGF